MSWLNFMIVTAKRSILMMDLSEDLREPWERAEDEELACEETVAEAEMEFFCLDEEPTALDKEPDEVAHSYRFSRLTPSPENKSRDGVHPPTSRTRFRARNRHA